MAERTGIMVLIRRHWKSILAAGIAAITVTALSVTTVTVATGGSIHIEGNGDLDITADSMIKSVGAADFLIESANNLSLSALGDGSVLAAAGSAHMGLVADFARLYVTGGGDVSANLGGLDFSAASAGDDIELAADDVISFQTTAGGTNYINLNSSGINLWTAAATTDDIYLASGDDIAMTAAANVVLTTTNGGVVRTQTDGVVIETAFGGDDILMSAADVITVQSLNDLSFVVTDDLTATSESFSITATGTGNLTSTGILTIGGSDINPTATDDLALIATDDGSFYAGDDLTLTSFSGPFIAIGGTGQIQLDANGLIVNSPVQSALTVGGTAYRLAPTLDFDYPNSAPASTAKTLMASQAIPAGALNAVGKGVGFVAMGTHLGNANVKRVSVEMGIAADTSGTGPTPQCNFNDATGTGWVVRGYFYRSGDDTQRAFIECMNNGIIQTVVTNATGALDDALPLFVNFTVENPTTAGDFTVHSVRWFWL